MNGSGGEPLLRVEGLRTWFPIRAGLFQRTVGHVRAVDDINLEIAAGETLALVGESLGYGGAPGPFFGHALAGLAIQLAGSEEQKRAWLPRLASGDAIGTVALGEANGIWQPEEWQRNQFY